MEHAKIQKAAAVGLGGVMFHKITEIIPLPGMRLKARFENGDVFLYNVAALKERWTIFKTLESVPELFGLARIDAGGHGIVWNDEIDLASEEIWNNGERLN
jgi:hypothetical protein